MQNDIWKDGNTQSPKVGKLCLGFFWDSNEWELHTLKSDDIDEVAEWNAERWCYLDDLLSQAEQAERYKKALEKAFKIIGNAVENFRMEFGTKDYEELTAGYAEIKEIIGDENEKF